MNDITNNRLPRQRRGPVAAILRRRRSTAAEERWAHAAQLSASLVRDAQRPDASALRVRNGGSSRVHGVTLVVRDRATGHCDAGAEAGYDLGPGQETQLTVPAWAFGGDRHLLVRFTDGELVTWLLDVASGTVSEARTTVGAHR